MYYIASAVPVVVMPIAMGFFLIVADGSKNYYIKLLEHIAKTILGAFYFM